MIQGRDIDTKKKTRTHLAPPATIRDVDLENIYDLCKVIHVQLAVLSQLAFFSFCFAFWFCYRSRCRVYYAL